ncbi:MAG: PRC-barrel domain-containing protein [Xanthobacteraceae bacterium]
MPKRIALLATAAALAVMPALAQQTTTPSQPSPSAQPSQTQPVPNQQVQKNAPGQMSKAFVDAQTSDQWLGSTLIGLKVKGSGDENIGSISDLLVEKDGKIVAAVIGVGGFLGIGQKNVAVSFESLNLTRTAEGTEQAVLRLTKAELESAPDFKPYEPPRPAASRPSGGAPGMTKKPGSGM